MAAMADPASRRALLGVPSDVFATWHDPHAEVRGRALAADPARAPRAASPPVFSPFEPLTPRHPRPAGPRVREPGRGLRPGRARRARAARAHPRARSRVRVRPLPRLKCNSNPPSDRHRCSPDGFPSPLGSVRRATCCFANTRVLPSDVQTS